MTTQRPSWQTTGLVGRLGAGPPGLESGLAGGNGTLGVSLSPSECSFLTRTAETLVPTLPGLP